MRGGLGWLGAVVILATSWSGSAAADEGERERRPRRDREEREEASGYDDWKPYAMRDEVDLQAWWWSASRIGSTFAFKLGGQGMVAENVAMGFHLPWTFNVRSAGDPIAAVGNPTIDVHYVAQAGIVTWHVGGGLSAPLASVQDDSGAYRFAALLGGSTLALYDSHYFLPAYFPVRAYGGAEIRATDGVSILLGASPIVLPPLEGQDAELVLQEHVEVIALSEPGFGGGLRLQGAHPLTANDLAQLSLEPYLAYDDEQSFFAKVGLLMALDGSLGFAFDQGKVLALHVTVGGYTGGDDTDSF